ncbi:unnamed protein product [Pleuronectes platessa]|uniref:Uncharacterized protein n=1 Tax=Pleuronectes platessa TaxID=8262 RepID=A0A9N7UB71_PLEPL|nr:unnamed protein product [Pleuronectes platessa]
MSAAATRVKAGHLQLSGDHGGDLQDPPPSLLPLWAKEQELLTTQQQFVVRCVCLTEGEWKRRREIVGVGGGETQSLSQSAERSVSWLRGKGLGRSANASPPRTKQVHPTHG